jgi:hypothetical protein
MRDAACSVLPGAQPVRGFTQAVEGEEERFHNDKYHYRGINPALVSYQGRDYVVIRSANYTLCPAYVWTGEGKPQWAVMEGRVAESTSGYASEVGGLPGRVAVLHASQRCTVSSLG